MAHTATLNTVSQGAATDKSPLLIVHGLFGSARNWGVITKRLSDERLVVAVDMRNHGESFRANSQSYANMAGDLAAVLTPLVAEHGPCHVLGHSMGGKAAMLLALTQPNLVKSLIVADISPVTYSHDNTPLVDAMQGLDLSNITRRSEADALLAQEIRDPGVRAFLLQSLVIKEKKWLLNLDVLKAEMPKIVGWPEDVTPATTGTYDAPALFLSGQESDYVSRDHRPVIKGFFPKARFASIAETGHWLHAEKPRRFEESVRMWMNAVED